MGRFQKPDNLAYTAAANPQGWNLYTYVKGNPVNFNDPTGHAPAEPKRKVNAPTVTTGPAQVGEAEKAKLDEIIADAIMPVGGGKEKIASEVKTKPKKEETPPPPPPDPSQPSAPVPSPCDNSLKPGEIVPPAGATMVGQVVMHFRNQMAKSEENPPTGVGVNPGPTLLNTAKGLGTLTADALQPAVSAIAPGTENTYVSAVLFTVQGCDGVFAASPPESMYATGGGINRDLSNLTASEAVRVPASQLPSGLTYRGPASYLDP